MFRSVPLPDRRSRDGRLLGIVAWGLAAVLLPARVMAQGPLDLAWDAPPVCPQQDAVRERIRSLAGESLRAAGELHAEGQVVKKDDRYRLTLTVRDGSSVRTRVIDSDSCADLAGAAAVALGLLLRSEPGKGASTKEAEAASSSEHANEPGKDETVAPEEPPRAATAPDVVPSKNERADTKTKREVPDGGRLQAILRAPFGTVNVGPLPKAGFGLGAGLGVRFEAWRFVALGRIFKAETLWSREVPDVGAHVGRMTAELSACRQWQASWLEIGPCVGLGLDRFTARGVGATVAARSAQRVSVVVGSGAVSHVYLRDWLALVGTASVGLETSRPRLIIEDFGEIRQLGRVWGSFGLASEWIF